MKRFAFAIVALVVAAVPARAQDPVKVASDTYKLIAENDRVRVLRATVAPGAKTAMHDHPAHLVVSLGAANVKFTTPDGKTADVVMKADDVSLMLAGAHAGENAGTGPVDVVIVELKGPSGSATFPATRPRKT